MNKILPLRSPEDHAEFPGAIQDLITISPSFQESQRLWRNGRCVVVFSLPGAYTPTSGFYDPGYCTVYGKPVSNAGNPDQGGREVFGHLTDAERVFGYRVLCISRGDTAIMSYSVGGLSVA